MSSKPRYQRVLLKVSGEGMCQPGGFGVDNEAVSSLVKEIIPLTEMGVQLALVVGGGNFLRGRDLTDSPYIKRVTADYMGMLATVMNALALRDALEQSGLPARVLSAIPMLQVCEAFSHRQALAHLEKGRVILLAGGTGSPFFTTDMCAALRANEIGADVLMKATKVDGVFDADPVTCPDAKKYDRLTYQKFLADRLGLMDLTAVSMCMQNHIPIMVFQLSIPGNLLQAVCGEPVGTIVNE